MKLTDAKKLPVLVWDWNGTLLDDVDDAVTALNRMLEERGCARIDKVYYREHFVFPVRNFYAELGVDLAKWSWDGICDDFHRYFAEAGTQKLRTGAMEVLAAARKAGFRQGILSAHKEEMLRADVKKFGIDGYLDFVCGTDNLDGASKLERGRDLIGKLDGSELLFIGDTLHDVEVAKALGGGCVLVSCGHQTRERLEASGCAIFDDLMKLRDVVGQRSGSPFSIHAFM